MKELFDKYLRYEENTGIFYWKIPVKGSKGIGKEAGTITKRGYKDVCIEGKKYGLHRVAFILKTGEAPTCVDHINGIKSDNRWCNLREATYNQNGYNYKGTGSNTGFKNVYYDPRGVEKKYFVAVVVDGKRLSGGYFSTPEEASLKAKHLRELHHKEFANHGI